MNNDRFIAVTKRYPCSYCGGVKYCSVAEDGSRAFCAEVSEGSVTTGLNGARLYIRGEQRSHEVCRPKHQSKNKERLSTDWPTYAACDVAALQTFADNLGVSAAALAELEVGYRYRSRTVPMFNGKRERVGIHRRFHLWNGKPVRCCITDSKLGLFMPKEALTTDELFLPEGMSDAAAMLTMGLCAAGRPSNSHGFEFARDLIRGREVSVVVVGDNDKAGRSGAFAFASRLRLYTSRLKVIYPPKEVNDVREWLQQGGDAAAVRAAVEAAKLVTIGVEDVR